MSVACYDKLGAAIVTNPTYPRVTSARGSIGDPDPIYRYDPRNLLGTPLIAGLSLLLCFFRYPPLPPPIRITSPSLPFRDFIVLARSFSSSRWTRSNMLSTIIIFFSFEKGKTIKFVRSSCQNVQVLRWKCNNKKKQF